MDENFLKKFPQKYQRWRLEQQLSYGLDEGEKINTAEFKKFWPVVKNRLDPKRKTYVEWLMQS